MGMSQQKAKEKRARMGPEEHPHLIRNQRRRRRKAREEQEESRIKETQGLGNFKWGRLANNIKCNRGVL